MNARLLLDLALVLNLTSYKFIFGHSFLNGLYLFCFLFGERKRIGGIFRWQMFRTKANLKSQGFGPDSASQPKAMFFLICKYLSYKKKAELVFRIYKLEIACFNIESVVSCFFFSAMETVDILPQLITYF